MVQRGLFLLCRCRLEGSLRLWSRIPFEREQVFLLGVYECVMGSGLLQRTFSGMLLPAGCLAALADALSGHCFNVCLFDMQCTCTHCHCIVTSTGCMGAKAQPWSVCT